MLARADHFDNYGGAAIIHNPDLHPATDGYDHDRHVADHDEHDGSADYGPHRVHLHHNDGTLTDDYGTLVHRRLIVDHLADLARAAEADCGA